MKPRSADVVEAEVRDRARLIYVLLRDAGPAGLSRAELAAKTGLEEQVVLLTVQWIRFHKVDVQYRRAVLPGDPNVFVLGVPLPAAWAPSEGVRS